MRQATTPELQAHIESEHATLARLMRLTPRGGDPILFTDHDQNIRMGDDVYLASSGFECSAIQNSVGGGNSNLEVSILLNSDEERQLVIGGYFFGAVIEIIAVNYEDPDMGHIPLTIGLVTNVSLPYRDKAILSFRGRSQEANRYLTEVYSPTCRAIFCDARCGLSVDDFRETFEVDTADGKRGFTSSGITQTTGFWDLGVVRWLTGANAGQNTEIMSSDAGAITLMIRTRYSIEAGDTGIIERGCAKTLAACRGYNNVLNFRGEPYMPGTDYTKSGANATPPEGAGEAPTAPEDEGASYG